MTRHKHDDTTVFIHFFVRGDLLLENSQGAKRYSLCSVMKDWKVSINQRVSIHEEKSEHKNKIFDWKSFSVYISFFLCSGFVPFSSILFFFGGTLCPRVVLHLYSIEKETSYSDIFFLSLTLPCSVKKYGHKNYNITMGNFIFIFFLLLVSK